MELHRIEKEVTQMENLSLVEKVNILFKEKQEETKPATKPIKIPRKAKVKKRKLKKGFIGILRIDENGCISGEKQKIEGGAFRDGSGKYHASDSREILFWEGKFPILIQQTWKKNPLQLNKDAGEKNETYGQYYIMAMMLGHAINLKKKAGGLILWIILGIAVLFGINYFIGGAA